MTQDFIDIARIVQVAMLGEVPPTWRFLYVWLEDNKLYFHATFTQDAPDEHLACANEVLTEVLAAAPMPIILTDIIERDSERSWRVGTGEHLMYLRYGEFTDQ